MDQTAKPKPIQSLRRSGVTPHIWALLGYFVLALVATYPTILHFTTQVPGSLLPDRNQHLWDIWWLGQSFSHLADPLRTGMLYHPYGADLYYHSLGISHGLIGLLPLLLFGLPAAYNTIVLAAFTLSGYGAFRLGLLYTHRPFPSFLGGVIFGLMPLTLQALKDGQTEVLSTQWIPFFVEAWIRAWRSGQLAPALAAGLFLALALYGSLYYAIYLILFLILNVGYSLATSQGRIDALRRALKLGGLTGGLALALCLPLAIGLVKDYDNPRFEIPATNQMLTHSADLLGLFAPPQDHPIMSALGVTSSPTDSPDDPLSRSYLTLGYLALALAVIGAVVAWRKRETKFWVLLGSVALVLALGPRLQIGDTITDIPMPFKLLMDLPIVAAIGKVSRFVVVVRLSMAVLASWGGAWIIDRLSSKDAGQPLKLPVANTPILAFVALLALLLVELPLYPRYYQPLDIPEGFSILAKQQESGALMELPVATRQVAPLAERMLYQTTHNRPIMGGYLARHYNGPVIDECSPFWPFIAPVGAPVNGGDIVTPTLAGRPLDVLNLYNIRYLALYSRYSTEAGPVDPPLGAAFEEIISRVSQAPPLYTSDFVSLYKVDSSPYESAPPSLHVGKGWNKIEDMGGAPFRWLAEKQGTFCIFSPRSVKASLVMDGVAYAQDRKVELWIVGPSVGDKQIYSGTLPAGNLNQIRTEPLDLSPGAAEVHIIASEPGTVPMSLDPNIKDARSLSIGVRSVHLEVSEGR